MEYQVPQFVEVEDKIFGPLTAVQFVYVAGGCGFAFAMWLLLPLWLAVLSGLPVAALGLALAFYKVNDRPLVNTLEAAFEYFINSKLYIWEKKKNAIASPEEIELSGTKRAEDPSQYVPAATANKIKDLSWSLDIHESMYSNKDQK